MWAGAVTPAHTALAVIVAAFWQLATGPVGDLDIPWHVLLGQDIVRQHQVTGVGTEWLGVHPPQWVTSQWLSEAGYAFLVGHWGWTAVPTLRIILLAATTAILAATLLPHRNPLLATPVAMLGTIAVTNLACDRPQTFSFLFLPLLGHWCVRLWERGRRPPLPAVGIGCLLWAQLHGSWILAPAAFGLVAAVLASAGLRRNAAPFHGALAATASSLTGVLNPHGFGSFLLPLQFHRATPMISEWRPSTIDQLPTALLVLLLLVVVIAWSRTRETIPPIEIVWVIGWWVFGMVASRNAVVSILLIAPAAVTALERSWGPSAARWLRRPSPRESRVLATAAVATLACGFVLALGTAAWTPPLAQAPALRIAERLGTRAAPVRVFNTFNASGSLAAFSRGKARLVIDGRADLWGAAYIRQIADAQNLEPGWEQTFEHFHPDAVVVERSAPLAQWLVHEGTWRIDLDDGEYVLLLPTAPLSSPSSSPLSSPSASPPSSRPRQQAVAP